MRSSIFCILASSLVLFPYAGFGNVSDSSARMVPRDGSSYYTPPQVDASQNPINQLTIIGIVSLLVTGFLAGFVIKGNVNSKKRNPKKEHDNGAPNMTHAGSDEIEIDLGWSTEAETQLSEERLDDNLEKIRRFKEWIKENAEQSETEKCI
jgi:hypothetical protein